MLIIGVKRRLNQKIKIVVPVYNDFQAFCKLINNIRNYLFIYNHNIDFVIVDDTPSYFLCNEIEYKINESGLDNKIKYMRGSGNYGDSLIKGIMRSGDFDKLITMDIDHPFYLIPDIISLLDVSDIVVGNDLNNNDERKVTKWLLKKTLGIDIPHPTCGLIGFNKDVLGKNCLTDKTIKFHRALSKKDIVHVEFIYMCMKKELMISSIDFDTSNSEIKHNYNLKRNIVWLKDLAVVILFDKLFNWYQ